MATKMCLDLTVTFEGKDYDLSDEFKLGEDDTLDHDKEHMKDRLVEQLFGLDAEIMKDTGKDVDTSMNTKWGPGHNMTVLIYSDHDCNHLIGTGETFSS